MTPKQIETRRRRALKHMRAAHADVAEIWCVHENGIVHGQGDYLPLEEIRRSIKALVSLETDQLKPEPHAYYILENRSWLNDHPLPEVTR